MVEALTERNETIGVTLPRNAILTDRDRCAVMRGIEP